MINKIIFSQWTKPANNWTGTVNNFGWLREKYAWMGLALSVFYARKALSNYNRVEFYTDNYGVEMVERCGIIFDKVDTCLEGVDLPASIWSAGKFIVIKKQTEPFLHIDGDVFLTRQLPAKYLSAPILYQSIEHFQQYTHYYATIDKMLKAMGYAERNSGFQVTPDLDWGMGVGTPKGIRIHEAFNTGIIGGTDLEFLHQYADDALFLTRANKNYWGKEPDILNSVVVEQWLLACMAIRNNKKAVNLIWKPEPEELGYHHYIASSKRRAEIVVPMAETLKRLQPEVYNTIENVFQYSEQCNPIGGVV